MMKTAFTVFTIIFFLLTVCPRAHCRDKDWAIAGKILTGVAAAGLLYYALDGGYYRYPHYGYYYERPGRRYYYDRPGRPYPYRYSAYRYPRYYPPPPPVCRKVVVYEECYSSNYPRYYGGGRSYGY